MNKSGRNTPPSPKKPYRKSGAQRPEGAQPRKPRLGHEEAFRDKESSRLPMPKSRNHGSYDSPRPSDLPRERGQGTPRASDAPYSPNSPESPVSSLSPASSGSPESLGALQAPMLLGVKPVLEMLATSPERIDAVFIRKGRHGKEMDEILTLCRKAKVRFSLLEPPLFSRQLGLTGQTQTQGVVARLFEAGFTPLETLFDTIMDAPLPLLVALDQVQDPGNAGTLARTLYSLGGAGLIIPRHNSVYLGAGATRAAAGALQKLPVARVGSLTQAIDKARQLGITIYGAAAIDEPDLVTVPATDIFTLKARLPALLILGSEESGIRQTLIKRCDSLVSIPMQRDFDSLNVAQAGAICIASFLRYHLHKA